MKIRIAKLALRMQQAVALALIATLPVQLRGQTGQERSLPGADSVANGHQLNFFPMQLGGLSNSHQHAGDSRKLEGYEYQFPAMGTLVTFKAFDDDQAHVSEAFEEAKAEVLRLASILTDYDPDSETRQLSSRTSSEPQQVSRDLWSVLSASDQWYQRTNGSFDSALGNLTQLWRKHRRAERVPTLESVHQSLQLSGWQHVRLLEDHHVQLEPGVQLDFGGIGKGWIIDQAFQSLTGAGLASCLVNISGNMRLGAPPPNRRGWRVEIAGLEANGSPLRRLELAYTSLATSGDLWQYSVVDGIRRSHVLDPKTGYGVPGPISATIVTQLAVDADAMATAACILPADVTELLSQKYGFEYFIASHKDGQTRMIESPTFRQKRLKTAD